MAFTEKALKKAFSKLPVPLCDALSHRASDIAALFRQERLLSKAQKYGILIGNAVDAT